MSHTKSYSSFNQVYSCRNHCSFYSVHRVTFLVNALHISLAMIRAPFSFG